MTDSISGRRGLDRDLEAIRCVGSWFEAELRCLFKAYLGEASSDHAMGAWLQRIDARRQEKEARA